MKYPIRRLEGAHTSLGVKCDSCLEAKAEYELDSNPSAANSPVRHMCRGCLNAWADLLGEVIKRFSTHFNLEGGFV